MKPHIAQTVADLRTEAARLGEMIAVLERYGAETDPTAPVPQLIAALAKNGWRRPMGVMA